MTMLQRIAFLAAIGVSTAGADPEAEVRAAVQALRGASGFAWETTTRQTIREYPDVKMPADLQEPAPVVEVRGRTEKDGYTEITLLPSKRTVDVPVTALSRFAAPSIARTPLGWLTRAEMRDTPQQNRMVEFEGQTVRLSRFFTAARRAADLETPLADLTGFLAEIGSFEESGGEVLGRLRPLAAAMMQEAGGNRSSGEISGTIAFRLREGALTGFEVRLETEIPRAGRDPIRSRTRWSTTLSGIGATTVTAPYEAVRKMAQE